MKRKKQGTGYKKKKIKAKGKNKERAYLSKLFIPFGKRISVGERIVKFLIYIGLRIILPPRKWKYPDKNFEIIDRTYKKIMSTDFIFIPSSIAFYFIMAFMPVITVINFISMIPGINHILSGENSINEVLIKYIPGIGRLLASMSSFSESAITTSVSNVILVILIMITSLWIASGGFAKLVFAQSYLYKYKFVGGFWMNKFRGMFIVLGFALVLSFALIFNAGIILLIKASNMHDTAKVFVKGILIYGGMILLVFLLFVGLFKWSPRFVIKIRHILPGAAVATIPTVLFLALFGFVTSLWNYSRYGVLGSMMYLGTSSLIVSYFMFVGLIANVAYFNTFVSYSLGKKTTISKK